MKNRPSILSTDHERQLAWIKKQIKIFNTASFLNPKKAIDEFENLEKVNMGFIENKDLENYFKRYLSEDGFKRLITTLRVAASRSKDGFALQANITRESNSKLNHLATKAGMRKNLLLERLIELAYIEKTTQIKREEDFEIKLKIKRVDD